MCMESLFGGGAPKQKEVKFEPLPTKNDESVKNAKRDAQLAAMRRKGISDTIKNKGGGQGVGDPETNRRSTLGGYES